MATFDLIDNSDQLSPSSSHVIHALEFTPSITAAMVGGTNTIKIGKLPAHFTVTGIAANPGDLDSGGSPALVFDLGVADDTNAFLAGSTAGQAGQGAQSLTSAGLLYVTTDTEEEVLLTVTTQAATGAAGTAKFVFLGYFS